MPSHLRLPGRTVPPSSLSTSRLHTAARASTQETATAIRSPATSLAPPSRSVLTSKPSQSNIKSLTESFPSTVHRRLQTVAMSTMPATHGHSEACCNIPPVVSSGYVPKGSYQQLGDMKTYVTGPADATKGIVSVSDIFGYFDQTLQGADILATGDKHQKYKVFIPDWFKGNPCPSEWYPPDTEQKQKDLGEWFSKNGPQGPASTLPNYVKALQAENPSIKSWGIIGYCWGGKVVELVTSSEANPFKIAAVPHPAMIDPSDAEKIPVPYILLASGEEPADVVKEFESKLKVPHHVETFADQVHGWMAARADLSNLRVKEEYSRGYKIVLEFFAKHWP